MGACLSLSPIPVEEEEEERQTAAHVCRKVHLSQPIRAIRTANTTTRASGRSINWAVNRFSF